MHTRLHYQSQRH